MSFLDKFFYMIGRSMRPMVQQKFDEHDPEKAEWYSKRVKELEEQEKNSSNWWEKTSINLNLVAVLGQLTLIFMFVSMCVFMYDIFFIDTNTFMELSEVFKQGLIYTIPAWLIVTFLPGLVNIFLIIFFIFMIVMLMV